MKDLKKLEIIRKMSLIGMIIFICFMLIFSFVIKDTILWKISYLFWTIFYVINNIVLIKKRDILIKELSNKLWKK